MVWLSSRRRTTSKGTRASMASYKRAQVWIYLLCKITGEKTQAFTCLHNRPGKHQFAPGFGKNLPKSPGHSQVGLAGSSRTDGKRNVVGGQAPQIQSLVGSPGKTLPKAPGTCMAASLNISAQD
jgi:hypothetical protein